MQYEERAVAFVDILGFKALVKASVGSTDKLDQLRTLVSLLKSAVPNLDSSVNPSVPQHLVPKHNYISDCIILSAPLTDANDSDYCGLEIVMLRVIQLTQFFLSSGYLIRGGLAVGKLWHTDSNIVGPAYQTAYKLEDEGDKPIIELCPKAAKMKLWGDRMRIQKDGKIFVNGLNQIYMPNATKHGGVEETFTKYQTLADKQICNGLTKSATTKWEWFKEYVISESNSETQWAEV